jgi:hypothetical protein
VFISHIWRSIVPKCVFESLPHKTVIAALGFIDSEVDFIVVGFFVVFLRATLQPVFRCMLCYLSSSKSVVMKGVHVETKPIRTARLKTHPLPHISGIYRMLEQLLEMSSTTFTQAGHLVKCLLNTL